MKKETLSLLGWIGLGLNSIGLVISIFMLIVSPRPFWYVLLVINIIGVVLGVWGIIKEKVDED